MPAKDKDRFSILVTDDDPEFRSAVCESIEPEGYHTLTAGSGSEAIRIVRNEVVHALIMDVNMPDIDGIEAFEVIEQIVPMHLPCIFMSGHLTNEVRMRAMMARAYTILPKPLSLQLVRMLVDDIIHKFYGMV
jgi:two-component system NtrC family response regulator